MSNKEKISLTVDQRKALSEWIGEKATTDQFMYIIDKLERVHDYLLTQGWNEQTIIYKYISEMSTGEDNAFLLKYAVDTLGSFDENIVAEILSQNNVNHVFLDNFTNHPDMLQDPVDKVFYKNMIEKNAPQDVVSDIENAKDHLVTGKYGDCLGSCRKAIEGMREQGHNLSAALDELIQHNLILDVVGQYKADKPMIMHIHKYCSTYGSHNTPGVPQPTLDQAMYGYSMTLSTLYFLLKLLIKHHSTLGLIRWRAPRV